MRRHPIVASRDLSTPGRTPRLENYAKSGFGMRGQNPLRGGDQRESQFVSGNGESEAHYHWAT